MTAGLVILRLFPDISGYILYYFLICYKVYKKKDWKIKSAALAFLHGRGIISTDIILAPSEASVHPPEGLCPLADMV